MAPWNLIPAIRAPVKSRRTWMSWIVLPVTSLKAGPRLPTMPDLFAMRDGVARGPGGARCFPLDQPFSNAR